MMVFLEGSSPAMGARCVGTFKSPAIGALRQVGDPDELSSMLASYRGPASLASPLASLRAGKALSSLGECLALAAERERPA